MSGEIDRKVLHSVIMRIEECSSFCALDTLIRIEDDDDKLYACRNCVFRNVNTVSTVREGMIDKSICPVIMKEEVNDVVR